MSQRWTSSRYHILVIKTNIGAYMPLFFVVVELFLTVKGGVLCVKRKAYSRLLLSAIRFFVFCYLKNTLLLVLPIFHLILFPVFFFGGGEGTLCLPIEISPSGYILLYLIHASQFHHEFLLHAWHHKSILQRHRCAHPKMLFARHIFNKKRQTTTRKESNPHFFQKTQTSCK